MRVRGRSDVNTHGWRGAGALRVRPAPFDAAICACNLASPHF
jgi:hypothetical protein